MKSWYLLGEKKAKKALLKNAANLQKIYEMYWDRINYEIIYPDRVEIKQKFKYRVQDILNKFNINSVNEVIFLLSRYHKPFKTCKFCEEDSYNFPIRNGIHDDDCGCTGICSHCNEPSRFLTEKGYCWSCKCKIGKYECNCENGFINLNCLYKLLNFMQSDESIDLYYYSEKTISCAISVLEYKLQKLYNLPVREEISHGCDSSPDSPG